MFAKSLLLRHPVFSPLPRHAILAPLPTWGSIRTPHRLSSALSNSSKSAFPLASKASFPSRSHVKTQVRWMCSIHDDKPEPKATWRDFTSPSGVRNQFNRHKGSAFSYVVVVFVGVAIYYVVKVGFSLADFFVNTSFYDVATVSFAAGVVTAGAIALLLSYTRRLFIIRPELVYQSVLAKVKSDPRVVALLGSDIAPGKFRAYSISDGGIQLINDEPKQYQGWERFWKPRKLQMMFQLEGSKEKGMVSFEAKKEFNGDMLFLSLTLDGLQSGEKLILEGDGSNKIYRGVIKLR